MSVFYLYLFRRLAEKRFKILAGSSNPSRKKEPVSKYLPYLPYRLFQLQSFPILFEKGFHPFPTRWHPRSWKSNCYHSKSDRLRIKIISIRSQKICGTTTIKILHWMCPATIERPSDYSWDTLLVDFPSDLQKTCHL